MAKCVTHARLKRVAEKYGILRKWLFSISSNTITFACLRKLAGRVSLREIGFKGEVRFARSSPILSPRVVALLAGIPAAWLYYNGFRLAMPLWRWRMCAYRLPRHPRGRRERVLQALSEFEQRIEGLARQIWEDAISGNSQKEGGEKSEKGKAHRIYLRLRGFETAGVDAQACEKVFAVALQERGNDRATHPHCEGVGATTHTVARESAHKD